MLEIIVVFICTVCIALLRYKKYRERKFTEFVNEYLNRTRKGVKE